MSESTDQHRSMAPEVLEVAVLTVSDTRSEAEDKSGKVIRDALKAAGHHVAEYAIVRDEPDEITMQIRAWIEVGKIQSVIVNGGTGISPRDRTLEALATLYDRQLDGFGELFRMLSFAEIGAAAMLSRASAGIVDRTPVFSIPGSRNAVALAMEKLVLPEMAHVVYEASK